MRKPRNAIAVALLAKAPTPGHVKTRFAESSRTITGAELATSLTSFDDAVAIVLANVSPGAPRTLPLDACADLVLADNVTALIDVPPFDNSSMDGYAVHADSTAAGDGTLEPVVKVMTGHPIPDDCDAVVPWEHTHTENESVVCTQLPTRGQFIRPRGEDVRQGETILDAGTRLGPAQLGLLAACGHDTAVVIPHPRVAVLVTGNELRCAGDTLAHGEIHDSNSVMLPALLRRAGADVVACARVRDDANAIARWMKEQSDIDLIVTSGGASVGEHDWVRTILGDLGSISVWRVAVKPGKPFAFGLIGETPVFVLPGNPASVLACTHAFVLPAMSKMRGSRPSTTQHTLTLTDDVAAPDDRVFLFPVTVDGSEAHPVRAASSSVLSNHVHADAYAHIPAGGAIRGDTVTVEMFC